MHLVVAAVLEGVCGDAQRTTSFDGPLGIAVANEGLVAVGRDGGQPTAYALDPTGRPTARRALEGANYANDAVIAGELVVTRGDGLRGYARDTGALRWHVYLPEAAAEESDVLVAYDPQHRELGVVWARSYLVSPDRPGYAYTALHFARLGLDGRWIDPRPVDLTPRDPRRAATLGHEPAMGLLHWTGRAYRLAWWQSTDGTADHGALRLGEVTRAGALAGRVVAEGNAYSFRHADGPVGTAIVWATARGSGGADTHVLLPWRSSRPARVVGGEGPMHIVWRRGAFFVAWDHEVAPGERGPRSALRLAHLDARGQLRDVREAPLDLGADEWSYTRGVFATPCGLVVLTHAMAAQRSRPWLWFVP